jgi:alkanesulfonate monooxygenase SsuD/methylene tetrahydromethanopterin reductase-like flavin-dependent oxidoreductase (luciferase family)
VAAPLRNLTVSRLVYIADSVDQAKDDMRAAVAYETGVQAQRGFLKMMKTLFDLEIPNDRTAIDAYDESGFYMLGEPDRVAEKLANFYDESGGFGTLLIVTGKNWADREKRARSMTLFMEQVAPRLRHLEP